MIRRLIRTIASPGNTARVRARLVERLAGTAAGLRQTRRGSFLVMVVGTLALLAVVTIVYVSIGRSDTQTSAAALKASGRDEVVGDMRDYLSQIIADDTFDTVDLHEKDDRGYPLFRREAWDYPSLDATVTVQLFKPTGDGTGADPFLASGEPSAINYDGTASYEMTDPRRYFRDRVDWLQMSDVAPDGMPVNLWALRDNPSVADDGFDATPGKMREDLSLLEDSPEKGNRGNQVYYGANAQPPSGNNARPADWFSGQRFAFFPKVDPVYGPNLPQYLLYQYGDADGDGLLDSRWFEMVADRDLTDNFFEQLLPTDRRLRYFWAVRIVDLSGRINVNTATDDTLKPEHDSPFGLTPSAVDLRRLLTLEDFYADRRVQFGYEELDQPNPPGSPDDYRGYDTSGSDGPNWYAAGENAYNGLRLVLDTGVLPPRPYKEGLADLTSDGLVDRRFGSTYWTSWHGNGQFTPTDYFELFAGFGPGGGTGNQTSALGRAFVTDTLFDLLAFNAVNDDRSRSPLESVMGGRGFGTEPALQFYSPLRDNRSTSLERDGRYTISKGGASFDLDALVASLVDVRQRLTTVSGARPIAPTVIASDPNDRSKPDPTQLPLTKSDLKRGIDELFKDGGTDEPDETLFKAYAAALLPYSQVPDHWHFHALPEYRTLFYGYRGGELAIRTAGHMALNMLDAYDNKAREQTVGYNPAGNRPTKRTLLINEDARSNVSGSVQYPWKLLDLNKGAANGVSLLADSAAKSAGDITVDAVNILGIEPQPFITEAASFVMYTDTPHNSTISGDEDYPQDLNNDGIPDFKTKSYRPSINGDPTESNPDLLFEAVVFQLHNPFGQDIVLRDSSLSKTDAGQYYFEYGGRFYKVTKNDFTTNAELNDEIDLPAGETKTFYILSADIEQITDRINNAIDPDIGSSVVDSWITQQIGDSAHAVRLTEFNPSTGATTFVSTGFTSPQSATAAENGIVKLWRIEKPNGDPDRAPDYRGLDESQINQRDNDTLVDRMRDPSASPVLNRELTKSEEQAGAIARADIGQEPPKTPTSEDNKGLTITRWGRVARREDPKGAPGAVVRGVLPAYCIEAKDQTDTDSQNTAETDGSTDSLRIEDFLGDNGAKTLAEALDEQSNGPGVKTLLPTLKLDPIEKDTGHKIGPNLDGVPYAGDADNAPFYVEPHIDNNKFEDADNNSLMRVADLLSPLGIGPCQIPGAADEDHEWTTLSEALALALYYDNPNAGESAYADAFKPAKTAGEPLPLLDRGCLRYDAFVPFDDLNQNGRYDPNTEYAERWGVGVPLAATLFDTLTTVPRRFGSLTSPTFGLVNVNTVSREAARSLPGLSPTAEVAPDGSSLWWWIAGPQNWHSDIATTLVAYRDKQNIFTRDVDGTEPAQGINFRDWWNVSKGIRLAPTFKNSDPPGSKNDTAREGATGVEALRGDLGFRSLGELTFLRDWGYPSNGAYPTAHDIDRLGYDGKAVDQPGVDSLSYGANDTEDDGVDDDFDERLAIASGIMNTVSVRSDIFAVWILMHGYQESDTKDLADTDPLVPSVARRFLMVVDRSNVTAPGQKPRILLFREVPL